MNAPRTVSGKRTIILSRLVANGLAQAAVTIATAHLVRFGFDHLVRDRIRGTVGELIWLASGLGCAAISIAWLRYLERVDAERIGQDYAFDVRMAIYDQLAALPPRALQHRSRGALSLRFVGDLVSLRRWVSLGMARLTVSAVVVSGTIFALFFLNRVLASAIGMVILIGAASIFAYGAPLQKATVQSRRYLSRIAANVSEKIASIAVVQIFGQTRRERRRLVRQSTDYRDAMVERARVAGKITAVSEITVACASALVLALGAWQVWAGYASPGTVVACMAIINLLAHPLRDMGRIQEYWNSARVSLQKVQEFLDVPSTVLEIQGAPKLTDGPGRLEFQQVTVDGGLEKINAIAEAGSVVALIGPNGAGKSTLLSLAARLMDPSEGLICLDGQDLSGHDLVSVRRAIGVVSPELPLLRGTIDRNLRYRWPSAPEEEVRRVCALCGVDDLLAQLPNGAQTRVSEGGVGLSLGQRQRIALARALLGNPRVLLLDEVDANLDPQAATVIDRLREQYHGTVLMVTHRPDRLRSADRIWYLEDGHLVEQGSLAELLANHGPTAHLMLPVVMAAA